MARLTATKAFNMDTFNLSTHFNAATNELDEGPFRVGLTSYDDRIVSTNLSASPREQLLVYIEDTTTSGTGLLPTITGGTVGSIQFSTGFGSSGTLWASAFRISDIAVSAVSTVAMLDSDSSADDRTFLASLFTGNDLIGLSQFGDKMNGFAGNDKIDGYAGNDTLFGDLGNDRMDGGVGNDFLSGGDDNDVMIGNRGTDELYGGNGNDDLRGGSFADTLSGGQGSDVLTGNTGADELTGGFGNDVFVFRQGDGADRVIDFVNGQDKFRIDTVDGEAVAFTETLSGADVVITFASIPGLSITVVTETLVAINAADFEWF